MAVGMFGDQKELSEWQRIQNPFTNSTMVVPIIPRLQRKWDQGSFSSLTMASFETLQAPSNRSLCRENKV